MKELWSWIKNFWLPVSALSLSVISLVLLVWGFQSLNQNEVCFEEQVVKSMSIMEKGAKKLRPILLPICGRSLNPLPKFKSDPILEMPQIKKWVLDLKQAQQLGLGLKAIHRPVHIVIRADQPFYYHVSNRIVEIGVHFADARGQLARAVFKSWIIQNHPDQHPLIYDILADFMWAVSAGEFVLALPGEPIDLNYDQSTLWPRFLVTYEKYCDWKWRMNEHFDFCIKSQGEYESLLSIQRGSQRTKSDGSIFEVTHLSLRPAVGAILWTLYQQLPIGKRNLVIENLLKKKVEMPILDMSSSEAAYKSIAEMTQQILKPLIADPNSDKTSQLIKSLLEKRQIEETKSTRLLILKNRISGRFTTSRPMWIMSESGLWLTDTTGLRRLNLPGRFLKVGVAYGIDCRFPTWEELVEISSFAERYVHISACSSYDLGKLILTVDARKIVDSKSAILKDLAEFDQIQFYLPALKALQENGTDLKVRLSVARQLPRKFNEVEQLIGINQFPADYISETEWYPTGALELLEVVVLSKGKGLIARSQ